MARKENGHLVDSMRHAEGIRMTEAVEQTSRVTDTDREHGHVFEPEILAFCCEH